MKKNKLNDAKLEALFAKAEFHANNLKKLFKEMKARKICNACGIDYEEAKGHLCQHEQGK